MTDLINQKKYCHDLDLNHGPSDLDTHALPTELSDQLVKWSTIHNTL